MAANLAARFVQIWSVWLNTRRALCPWSECLLTSFASTNTGYSCCQYIYSCSYHIPPFQTFHTFRSSRCFFSRHTSIQYNSTAHNGQSFEVLSFTRSYKRTLEESCINELLKHGCRFRGRAALGFCMFGKMPGRCMVLVWKLWHGKECHLELELCT